MLLSSNSPNYYSRENAKKNNNNCNENLNNNKTNNYENRTNTIFNMSNNVYTSQSSNKNIFNNDNNIQERIEVDCICDNNFYENKKDIIQCFLCHKYQHLSCIYQSQYITPYICFNCQFINYHFYLKWKKTILPAKEIIYKKKWEEDKDLLKEGTKKFEFFLNIKELAAQYNNDNNNSHYIALLCLTNNGKPFQLGFPDNMKIQINNKQFFFTDKKGFKKPLLLAIDNTPFYVPKKRHLITSEKVEIPNITEFFIMPKSLSFKEKYIQKITISFEDLLENYRGSEFEFVDVRHYLFYIGVFQEIKIPSLNIIKNGNDLKNYSDIFMNLYKEKVRKLKWDNVQNFVTLGFDEINLNFLSSVSYQKIIFPVRGLFCQHSEVLDYGECCGYITSTSQVYKCFKCNKPLNIMYIDDVTETMFNRYRNYNFSQIYYNNQLKLIKGDKINENKEKAMRKKEEESNNDEEDSLSESFFEFYKKENIKDNFDENNNNEMNDDIIQLNSSSDSINDLDNNNNQYPNRDVSINSNNNDSFENYINNNNINNNRRQESFGNDLSSFNSLNEFKYKNNNFINENYFERNYNNNISEEVITLLDDEEEVEEKLNENEKVNERRKQIEIEKENNNNNENNVTRNDKDLFEKMANGRKKQNIIDINKILSDNSINNNKIDNDRILSDNLINNNKINNYRILSNNSINNNKVNNDKNKKILNREQEKNKKKEKGKERQNIFGVYVPYKNNIQNKSPSSNDYLGKKRKVPEFVNGKSKKLRKNKENEKEKEKDKDKEKGKENKELSNEKILQKRKKSQKMPQKTTSNYDKFAKKSRKRYDDKKKKIFNFDEEIKEKNKNRFFNNKKFNNEISNFNYLNVSGNNNIINYNINNSNENKFFSYSPFNKNISDFRDISDNYSEDKKNGSSSDIESISNSNNLQNRIIKKRQTNKGKENKNKKNNNEKSYEQIEEEEDIIGKEDILLLGKEEEKKFSESEKKKYSEYNNHKDDEDENHNKKNRDSVYEFETFHYDSKNFMEVRPYNEYKKNINQKSPLSEESEDPVSENDTNLFECDFLNSRQDIFLNYDYYNIQRKLREICSDRYLDDEIFIENKSFFKKFS